MPRKLQTKSKSKSAVETETETGRKADARSKSIGTSKKGVALKKKAKSLSTKRASKVTATASTATADAATTIATATATATANATAVCPDVPSVESDRAKGRPEGRQLTDDLMTDCGCENECDTCADCGAPLYLSANSEDTPEEEKKARKQKRLDALLGSKELVLLSLWGWDDWSGGSPMGEAVLVPLDCEGNRHLRETLQEADMCSYDDVPAWTRVRMSDTIRLWKKVQKTTGLTVRGLYAQLREKNNAAIVDVVTYQYRPFE